MTSGDAPEPQASTVHQLIAPPNVGRLDRWVAGLLNVSRASVQRWNTLGSILVDGRQVKAGHKLKGGEQIHIEEPPPPPTEIIPQPLPLEILHIDESVIVVNKAAGMVVHPGKGHPDGTLVNGLVHLIEQDTGDVHRPGLVHRIDKGTSGVMVVARTELALQCLAAQFADHSIEREYQAICWGEPQSQTIDHPLGRHPNDRIRFAVVADGKRAVTHVQFLRSAMPVGCGRGGRVSLISCRLETGRTHQIRVHLKHIGHSLLGDPLYDTTRPVSVWRPQIALLDRQLLHARLLGFVHPNGRRMSFSVEPPEDFKAVLEFSNLVG